MDGDQKRAIVIGCGVSGLTSGVLLLEAGFQVTIWARDLPPNTTSNVAAAIWHPFRAYPIDRVTAWSARSQEVFLQLAGVPETGIYMTETLELARHPVPDPFWRDSAPVFRRAVGDDLPPGFVDGFIFETPVIEMGIYLGYLVERFRNAGGEIVQREVGSLEEALGEAQLVVNCTGLGSRALLGDEHLYPVRGQILRVSPLPGKRGYLDQEGEDVTYIIPRSNDCILGGTTQEGNWSLEPDMATAADIVERCALLVPAVREARVLEHKVGLRPGRDAVRLEVEEAPGGRVIHNYGHGGAGVTLSWGCAEEVIHLALH